MTGQGSGADRRRQLRWGAWWREHQTQGNLALAAGVPLVRDMVTLLTYVRDNKVTGTQSTGNMPLKHIRALTAQFVDPPQLDTSIGDQVYKLRTEYDVWPLYLLHVLADVSGLLEIAPGRIWRLREGHTETFLGRGALVQLCYLFEVWWWHVNWAVAFPVQGLGEFMPDGFSAETLAQLRAYPAGVRIDFDAFADRLVAATGLVWGDGTSEFQETMLRSAVERTVVNILVRFGAAVPSRHPDPRGLVYGARLEAFEITPLGKLLLDYVSL